MNTNGPAEALDSARALLYKPFTIPTASRKVQAASDYLAVVVAALPYAVMTALRFLLSRFGLTEHQWKGIRDDLPLTTAGRKHLIDCADGLATGSLDLRSLLSNEVPSSSSGSGRAAGEPSSSSAGVQLTTPAAAVILQHLQTVLLAADAVATAHGLPLEALHADIRARMGRVLRQVANRKAVNPHDALKQMRGQGKAAVKKLGTLRPGLKPSALGKEYTFRCLMQGSLHMSRVREETVLDLGGGRQLVETCRLLSLQPGLEYLKLQGQAFDEQASFITEFGVLRPSDVKTESAAQAATINARLHTLSVRGPGSGAGAVQEVAGHLRSGAFAVHGRAPLDTGLAGLLSAQQLLTADEDAQARSALLARLGLSGPSLAAEIRHRSVVCMAQALPVVTASLARAVGRADCWEAAARAGAFLHVQQSLLSDLHTHEHSYLQDMAAALDLLSSRLEVRFAHRPVSSLALDATTQRITLTLDAGAVPEEALPSKPPTTPPGGADDAPARTPLPTRAELLGRTYRLQAVLFSQGVNLSQSLGMWRVGDSTLTLQDRVNSEGVLALNRYASAAGRTGGPALSALNHHYGPFGQRAPKDVHGIALVRRAAEELGGVRAVNCKSGKDRTAIELSHSFADRAVEVGVLPAARRDELVAALQSGLSYKVTSENNGQPSAYAFSELELAASLPSWRPSWRLCGKVLS